MQVGVGVLCSPEGTSAQPCHEHYGYPFCGGIAGFTCLLHFEEPESEVEAVSTYTDCARLDTVSSRPLEDDLLAVRF